MPSTRLPRTPSMPPPRGLLRAGPLVGGLLVGDLLSGGLLSGGLLFGGLLFGGLLTASLAGAPAHAAGNAADEAERVRLSEDMKRLSRRNAWTGVEDAFQAMEELTTRGVEIPQEDYLVGAEAARNVGDMLASHERLVAARQLGATPDITGRIEAIEAAYQRVTLVVEPKYVGEAPLQIAEEPFAADQRKAIAYAKGRLELEARFEGMLPFGQYTFGPKGFELQAGGGLVSVALTQADGEQKERGLAFVGPRVDVGAAYTVAGAPGFQEGELHPDGFSGAGARAGVGVELGLHGGFGALVEVGYHGMLGGAPDVAEDPAYEASNASLHQGFGWLAGTWRIADFGVALGPVLATGVARASGLSGYCDGNPCSGVEAAEAAALSYQPMKGSILSFGGSVGLSYGFLDLGGLSLGAGLLGGAQSDGARMYPWGQLGLTLAPQRRDG